jgi:hypothetical protein
MFVGGKLGRENVLHPETQVDITSKFELNLGIPDIISSSGKEIVYQYNGLKLLTVNERRYFLFREVDSITSRPKAVYIIDCDKVSQIKLTDLSMRPKKP